MRDQESKRDCRVCRNPTREIVDLGISPPANNFINKIGESATSFPLVVDLCDTCKNIQLRDCLDEKFLYSHYTYLTPNIDTLTNHYEKIISYLQSESYISNKSSCLEIGSNNGLFLKHLSPKVGNVLGVDPAKNIAKIANDSGIETIPSFFDQITAENIMEDRGSMDLVVARHMFAHNANPSNILLSIKEVLDSNGIIMIENAYAIPTFLKGEFDQIYHEHMFYYTVRSISYLLDSLGFDLIDLFETGIHGGSLVFIASYKGVRQIQKEVDSYLSVEDGLFSEDKVFKLFSDKISSIKVKVLSELEEDFVNGRTVGAYGATAKAFTMFSFLELNNSEIRYCIDTSPTKIGKFFPKFNIKVVSEDHFKAEPVDTLLVTAWNYKDHIKAKSKSLFSSGTKLIFPLPEFETFIV